MKLWIKVAAWLMLGGGVERGRKSYNKKTTNEGIM